MLVEELKTFRVRIDPATAHDSYGAWRESEHDDLTLAVATACFVAHRQPRDVRGEYALVPPGALGL